MQAETNRKNITRRSGYRLLAQIKYLRYCALLKNARFVYDFETFDQKNEEQNIQNLKKLTEKVLSYENYKSMEIEDISPENSDDEDYIESRNPLEKIKNFYVFGEDVENTPSTQPFNDQDVDMQDTQKSTEWSKLGNWHFPGSSQNEDSNSSRSLFQNTAKSSQPPNSPQSYTERSVSFSQLSPIAKNTQPEKNSQKSADSQFPSLFDLI